MTNRRSNGASPPDTITSFVNALQAPAANSFLVSQRFALEAARFWARRMHAYADQMEALAACATPDDMANAQKRFIDRMRDDYAAESAEVQKLLRTTYGEAAAAQRASAETD